VKKSKLINTGLPKTFTKYIIGYTKFPWKRVKAFLNFFTKTFLFFKLWFIKQDSVKIIDYRLPANLKPFNYDIKIKPYIGPFETYGNKSFTFDGQVNISFTCLNQTDGIFLHSKDLTILETKLFANDAKELSLNQNLKYDEIREFLSIEMSSQCEKNANYTLHIKYIGLISDSLAGFYRSSYTNSNKTLK